MGFVKRTNAETAIQSGQGTGKGFLGEACSANKFETR
jgi:hypothetical protein